ncbi:MAG: hypothetical protein CR972_00150 [Candidatus Moraniibacteriota bacterium]|nr:MAG: hypothetical protein CR972_00150 [Candidatus Moranbacteria bacterium]
MKLPKLLIRDRIINVPILQGGMGIGISLSHLSGAVAREGGCGIVSSAGLHFLISQEKKEKVNAFTAAQIEIQKAQKLSQGNGAIGMNIMVYIARDFEDSVRGSIAGGADMIICGAGLQLNLPDVTKNHNIALIPIVSSLRALQIICKRWAKKKRRPDAVIVEGPLAGGHLGFKFQDVNCVENSLEHIFPPIKEWVEKNGNFPVIVAGGIFDHEDICTWIHHHGANGVQMGTRFLATHESGATKSYKKAVVDCSKDDIIVVHNTQCVPGSPSGMPFRSLKNTPMILHACNRIPKCTRGFVAQKDEKGNYTLCDAQKNPKNSFCICNGLLASCGAINDDELYTVGTNAARIQNIISVKTLMKELRGI